MHRTTGFAAALVAAATAVLLLPAPATAASTGGSVGSAVTVASPASHGARAISGYAFKATPRMAGKPQWKPRTTVSYSLSNFTTAQAKLLRSALKENGKATQVTFTQVSRNATFTLTKRKLYSTGSNGRKTALPNSVVGTGGPVWNQDGRIVAAKVEISPKASSLSPAMYRSLVLHEIGHASGLDHSDHATSVMYPSLSADSPSHYSNEDLAGLKPR